MIYYVSITNDNIQPSKQYEFITLYKNLGNELSFTFNDKITYGTIRGYEHRHYLAGNTHLSGICLEVYQNGYGLPGIFMHSLFIKDEQQKCGVGRACITGLIRICEQIGLKFIALCASPSAEGFWRKMSFSKLPPELEDIFWPSEKKLAKEYTYKYIMLDNKLLQLY